MYDGVCSDPEVFGTFKAKMPRDEFEDFIGDWMFLSGMSSPFEYVLMHFQVGRHDIDSISKLLFPALE